MLTQVFATTISGPALVGYGATVHLGGVGSPPGSTVKVYFRRQGSTAYTARRVLISDAAGRYSTTYIADTGYHYYAVANGIRSNIGASQLVTAACASTGPIMRSLPFANIPLGGAYASLQANDGHGRYAGFAYDSLDHYALISWQSGHPLSIVARYTYPLGSSPTSSIMSTQCEHPGPWSSIFSRRTAPTRIAETHLCTRAAIATNSLMPRTGRLLFRSASQLPA